MAAIGSVVVPVFPVEMPDEDLAEVPGTPVNGLEPFDVAVSDEAAVEGQKLVEFLVHFIDTSAFNDFFEVFDDGYHDLFLLSLFSFWMKGWVVEFLHSWRELKGLGSFLCGFGG